MKTLFLSLLAVLGSVSALAAPSTAEVAELQFHKLNRLVATNKIDAAYVNHLGGITVKPDAGDLLVTFFQENDSNGAPDRVIIRADLEGKPKSFEVIPGTKSLTYTDWTGKVPADILEKAVEYVSDTTTDARLDIFRERISSAVLLPQKDASGLSAMVTVRAGERDGILLIHLDLAGKVLSVEKQ